MSEIVKPGKTLSLSDEILFLMLTGTHFYETVSSFGLKFWT